MNCTDKYYIELGKVLKDVINRSSVNIKKITSVLDISMSLFSQYLSGKVRMPVDVLHVTCELLNVRTDHILNSVNQHESIQYQIYLNGICIGATTDYYWLLEELLLLDHEEVYFIRCFDQNGKWVPDKTDKPVSYKDFKEQIKHELCDFRI